MGARSQRDMLVDAAVQTCIEQGYQSMTMAKLADTASMTTHDACALFATTEAAVLATIVDILHAIVDTLDRGAVEGGPDEVLRTATTRVIAAIATGDGVIPRERLEKIALVLTETPVLREASRVLRFEILAPALARHQGVPERDFHVQHAITMWSAVIAASYNFTHRGSRDIDPGADGRRPEMMTDRLNSTFSHIVGRPGANPDS